MTPENEKELWEFVGEVRTGITNLNKKFDNLPCGGQSNRIDKLEDWQNQMIGKVSIISVIIGVIGYFVTMGIDYLIKK